MYEEDEVEIPIYLITGFLESGKTSFINFTVAQEYFQIDGPTLLITTEEGEVEYDEKELLKLTDNGEYSLDERVGRLPKVSLMLADGSVYPLQGRVATVSGVIDNTTGAAQVRALFDNPKAMLRSGSTGNVIIPTHSHNVILVPQKATFEIQDMKYVYTVNDTNGTVPTQIKVLDLNDGKSYVVTDGLKPGDRIVVEGVGTSVRDNMKIKPVTAQEKAAMEAKK